MSLATGPLERLVKLLADESQLDEKIRETQAALTLVKNGCRNLSRNITFRCVSREFNCRRIL